MTSLPSTKNDPDAQRRKIARFVFDTAIAEGFRLGTDGSELIILAPRNRDPAATSNLSCAISDHWREIIPLVQERAKRGER